MYTVAAQEIKRQGISCLDDILKEGPVHIIKNNQPQYVVLTQEHYQAFLIPDTEAYSTRLRQLLEEVQAAKICKSSAQRTLSYHE
ncbi:hypothetical protein BH10PSE19_BH10PSE19_10060 [soil metagenome]